ncbi:hypothetical protein E3N88_46139 [Mikania micrantha]|uniref:Uncharacterized protein n=1 Tax=Mikania micrantha TaxID=192012 RepID=A0A5N6L730_9ASTR|nr:hypothetical protein E3N88_46139 [Mikania micrantha]
MAEAAIEGEVDRTKIRAKSNEKRSSYLGYAEAEAYGGLSGGRRLKQRRLVVVSFGDRERRGRGGDRERRELKKKKSVKPTLIRALGGSFI